jgi:hypothetical protein
MAKKGGKKGKKGKGKAPKEMMSPAQIEAALATLPQPTLRGEASPRIAIRVNELVAVKFTKDPVGLVEHLKALDTGLNSINEAGWTALMRAARDGMKNHVELLLEAVRQAMPNLPLLMPMVASKLLNKVRLVQKFTRDHWHEKRKAPLAKAPLAKASSPLLPRYIFISNIPAGRRGLRRISSPLRKLPIRRGGVAASILKGAQLTKFAKSDTIA